MIKKELEKEIQVNRSFIEALQTQYVGNSNALISKLECYEKLKKYVDIQGEHINTLYVWVYGLVVLQILTAIGTILIIK